MDVSEVERWAARVVDQIERGVRGEDDRVELKREPKAEALENARRIAGHANQVRKGSILWIFGLDEDGSRHPLPASLRDPNSWWEPISACFDEVSPSPVVAFLDDKELLAIGFETERVPFVVKRSGDGASREVPWREGTRVRTASRHDLLKVLAPTSTLPSIQLLDGTLKLGRTVSGRRERLWNLSVWFYVDSVGPLAIPDHLLNVAADMHCLSDPIEFPDATAEVQPTAWYSAGGHGPQVTRGARHLSITGPAPFVVESFAPVELDDAFVPVGAGKLDFRFGLANDRTVFVTTGLHQVEVEHASMIEGGRQFAYEAQWEIRPRSAD